MANTGHARDYAKIARDYARRAVDDRQQRRHCGWVRKAAQRYQRDMKRAQQKTCPFYFSDWWANDVCDFIEKLPHVEGQWESATIHLEPWQIFILVNVFGFRQRETDARRFNTAYIEVARKNAKSTLSAGVGLYCLACEGEPGPQIKSAATTGDQARIVWGVARKMVQATKDMRDAFGLETWSKSISCADTGGDFQPINAKSSTQDGLNPHCAIIDELHAHKDRGLFDVLRSARGARRNPLGWYITTAGYNMNGVCYEQRLFVSKMLDGVLEADHYFGIVFTLDEADDAFDPKVWLKANPNLGVSVGKKELQDYAREAEVNSQSEGDFKTKRCNRWLNAAGAWLNMAQWEACQQTTYTLADFAGHQAWIGADLADRDDIASIAIVFAPEGREGHLYAFCRHYLPKDHVDRLAHSKGAHYAAWARDGTLDVTEGDWIDHDTVEAQIRAWCDQFEVRSIFFDQFGGAQQMAQRLAEQGYSAELFPKNAGRYTDPAMELEAKVKTGKFQHIGDPCLKWMASNTVVSRGVNGSILPKKETQDSPNKIDAIDATIMGIAGMVADLQDQGAIAVPDDYEFMIAE
ncbi:MAG: terminase TerL endonuclease subunit [Rhodovibrio sp.]|nr:terminase TerL endonuclease subunit [Rhodovibrio sp.]